MDTNEIKQRLELALKHAEPPNLEEVFEQVSTHGVLRGPVDWVFPAWATYVDYVVQKIAESFRLTKEEKAQLPQFRDAMKRLLLDMWKQTKEKLAALHKAVLEGIFKIERGRLYAPGAWMYINANTPHIKINDISASARFPDLLKLPRERLELFQLGWRASDEGNKKGWPDMETAQPWQVFAWVAARYGDVYIRAAMVNLTREGVSASIHIIARSWRQRWNKAEAISLVADHLRRGEWGPLLAAWLGDGNARWSKVLRGKYVVSIAAKEPWRLGLVANTYEALVATGREAFVKLREAAGAYGELLDLLRVHKWIYIKLATDDGLRVAYKLMKEKKKRPHKTKRISATHKRLSKRVSAKPMEAHAYVRNVREAHTEADKLGVVAVAGFIMHLQLVSGRGGSLLAVRHVRKPEKALEIVNKLKAAELRPNIVRAGPYYMIYIATTDLLGLAEKDEAIRRAIALYLAEKAKNGTPRQREIAEKS